jgi:hypothetical protein
MMEAVAAAPGQPAARAGGDPFGEWCRLRAAEGERVSNTLAYTEAKNDLILDLLDQVEQLATDCHWPG